tara:strand:- start:3080 stop:3301 length:222 start_codon:yes stop_codon:yes gene_type:complete
MHESFTALLPSEIKLQQNRKTAGPPPCCNNDTAAVKSGDPPFPILYSAMNAAQFQPIHMGGSLSGTISLHTGH